MSGVTWGACSNDRNCERNENRNNGNRLFDSQNNAKVLEDSVALRASPTNRPWLNAMPPTASPGADMAKRAICR
jgi:hypothetical protein